MLELKHIHKMYNPGTVNEICLFEDFNLSIKDGQFVSVVGSNGSGKTSMLNIICGSIPVDGGSIVVNGTDITKQKDFIRHRRIGRVFQDPSKGTCPSMTILENLSTADNKGKVAPDLKTAKAYISVLGDEKSQKETIAGLRSAEGFIRRSLAKTINLRNTPEITFILDQSIEYGIHMSRMIDEVTKKDAKEKPDEEA